jgi:hypothetical protein
VLSGFFFLPVKLASKANELLGLSCRGWLFFSKGIYKDEQDPVVSR